MFFLHIQGASTPPCEWSISSWHLMDLWKQQLNTAVLDYLTERHDKFTIDIIKWLEEI
jgi:hypothetical protein